MTDVLETVTASVMTAASPGVPVRHYSKHIFNPHSCHEIGSGLALFIIQVTSRPFSGATRCHRSARRLCEALGRPATPQPGRAPAGTVRPAAQPCFEKPAGITQTHAALPPSSSLACVQAPGLPVPSRERHRCFHSHGVLGVLSLFSH